MKYRSFVTTSIALLLVLSATSDYANADSSSEEQQFLNVSNFEGHIVFCAPQLPPVDVIELPGGGQILKFINIGNIWLTGNPLVDGVEENKVAAKFDSSGIIELVNISGKVDVAAVDGSWRFHQRIAGETGFGLGLGSGDLRGKLLLFETGAPEEILNSPCEFPFGAPLTGKVISFGWFW